MEVQISELVKSKKKILEEKDSEMKKIKDEFENILSKNETSETSLKT